MTALEREYRFLIRRAERDGDAKLAADLSEHALLRYDLDLSDPEDVSPS